MSLNGTIRAAIFASAASLALAIAAPGTAAAQDKVYNAGELSSPASVKSKTAAANLIERHYPNALQRVGGKVQLQFVVLEDGSVDESSVKVVVATAAALGDAASKAVKKMEFVPGKVDGKPVRAIVMFPVVYAAR